MGFVLPAWVEAIGLAALNIIQLGLLAWLTKEKKRIKAEQKETIKQAIEELQRDGPINLD